MSGVIQKLIIYAICADQIHQKKHPSEMTNINLNHLKRNSLGQTHQHLLIDRTRVSFCRGRLKMDDIFKLIAHCRNNPRQNNTDVRQESIGDKTPISNNRHASCANRSECYLPNPPAYLLEDRPSYMIQY